MKLLNRSTHATAIQALLADFPVVGIIGPRQCGKTTLARSICGDHYFDLENPQDLARLSEAQLALAGLSGLIVIDEMQRKPDLFPLLRYLVDTHSAQRYLLLGSASPPLLKQSTESLAGRIAYYQLPGFSLAEVGLKAQLALWIRGAYPRSFLASSDAMSLRWRREYISAHLERDLPQLGLGVAAPTMRRFFTMLAHNHGQILNSSAIARSLGGSDVTVRTYAEILDHTFMARLLLPWQANIAKRQVKRPKVYVRDSGLLHALMGVGSIAELEQHPLLGHSFEGFAVELLMQQICELAGLAPQDFYFWSTHTSAELDLLWWDGGRPIGVEVKYSSSPHRSKSMLSALESLDLAALYVVHPGRDSWPLGERLVAVGLADFAERYKRDRERHWKD